MKNVSRPASRSGPLATAISGISVTPEAASVSRAALSWPWPPSIRTRSGQGDLRFVSLPGEGRVGAKRRGGVNLGDPHPATSSSDLPRQGEVLESRRLRLARRLADQPLEPPRQHLAHHAEVVARREVLRADIELAVLVLAEAFGPATIIAPTAFQPWMWLLSYTSIRRGGAQPEGLGEPIQQVLLRLRL